MKTQSTFDDSSIFRFSLFSLELEMRDKFPALLGLMISEFFEECNTSITMSHQSIAKSPSIRKPASREITSDSVEL